MEIQLRTYSDWINEDIIEFHSDASQELIDSLNFNGEWYVVREILLNCGYKIIEDFNIN